MKKTSITTSILLPSRLFSAGCFFVPFALLLFTSPLWAQQQSSKSKSSDKLYEKGEILRNILLENANGVNSPKLEFSPAFYENGIVFVSMHKNGPLDPKTGKPFFELFYAEFDAKGLPQKPREFSLQINSQVHEGPVSFSRDGNQIYFTRNNLEGGIATANTKGQVPMKIYEAKRGRYDWEGIKEMPFNSNEYTCFHPTLSADGLRLFFASDMPGGHGGYDLYFVEKKADTWSKPVNLGAQVNTSGNEVFPFLHESGTMFFASNGHPGNGGLDIFMVDISDNKWGDVINLGTPYNSAMDDLGFILNPEATRGYLSSDRPGGLGDDDIYAFESSIPIIRNERVMLDAQVLAYDARTNERLPNASVRILRRTADGFIEGNNVYDVDMTPSENGDLVVKLKRKSADELGEATIFTNNKGEANLEMVQGDSYLVLLSREGYENEEVLHATTERVGAQIIRVPMHSKSCTTLDGLVSVNGYRNGVPNAVVRIVNMATGQEETLYSNSSGQFDYCVARGYDYTVFAEKAGYTSGSTMVSTKSGNASEMEVTVRLQPPTDANESETVVSEPIRTGSVIVLENIYYDFNQFFIRRGAAQELDALAQLMKQYPSMEVQLIAHTDSRGDDKYNLDLSVKRADSAKRYLVAKGIPASRIEAFGYGEREIRNHCKNGVECEEEEHQFNRRTEVKVIRIDEPVQVEYGVGNPVGNE